MTGPFGVGQFTLADTDSAGDVADSINSLTGTTGVTATATNVIRVAAGDLALQGSGPTADSVSLTIGTNRGNGIDQSTTDIVLTATGDAAQDLQNLRDAINADSGGNGLSAIIDENGNLDITAKDGDNIQVTNYVEVDGNTTANDSTITFTAVNTNDATPTVQLVNGGPNTSLEAIGTLTFDSSAPFSLSSTATGLDEISAQSIGVLQSIDDIDVTNVAGAQDAIAVIDGAIANIDSQRAQLGAVQNRFQNTIANLQSIIENVSAARSRIKDTDFAAETAELTRNQILQQAGTTILAQANQLPQAVLGLLGG
ncbi:hypothetical protein LU351_17805 [Marinibactrum halimedae]|nr:hypothetical protein [Marinibactrum halimedae]